MANARIDIWNLALGRIGESQPLQSETDNRPAARQCLLEWDNILKAALGSYGWVWALSEGPIVTADSRSQTFTYDDLGDPWTIVDIPFAFKDASKQLTVVHIDAAGTETTLVADTDYTVDATPAGQTTTTLTLAVALAVDEKVRVTVTTRRNGWDHVYVLPADCVKPVAVLYGGVRYEFLAQENRTPFKVVANDGKDGKLLCCDLAPSEIDTLEYVALQTYVPLYPPKFVDALALRLASALATSLKKDTQKALTLYQLYEAVLEDAAADDQNDQQDSEPETPLLTARRGRG